jgi:N-acetylglutamate synthase-like GNAT family acetyltransferase
MDLIYKTASINDLSIIEELARVIWNEHYINIITQAQIDYMLDKMYSLESLKKQIQQENCEFALVCNQDRAIGFISIMPTNEEKTEYLLSKLYIHNNSRGTKAGQKLFEYSINQLTNLKIMRLYVNRANYKSINFYFKIGFKIEKVVDQDIGNGYYMNDFIMVKNF